MTTSSANGVAKGANLASDSTPCFMPDQLTTNRLEGTHKEPRLGDISPHFDLSVIWLDRHHRKMGIGILGIDRTGIIACVTKKLRDHGLNIDSGFESLIETAAGAFFEISGDPKPMRRMFEEILRDRHQQIPLCSESPPPYGMTYELKIIAPDRPGIVHDISKRLIEQRINIDQMVIRTKRRRRMGIVYGRLGIPSEEAQARFLASLRSVEGYEQWRISCQRWHSQQRQDDSINDMTGRMN